MFRKIFNNLRSFKFLRVTFKLGMALAVVLFFSSMLYKLISAKPIDASIDPEVKKRSLEEVIQVNVLNACGEPGAANEVMHYLRKIGFDVVEIGNYGKIVDYSKVIDRVGDLKSAEKVAYALGVDDDELTSEIDSSMFLRCTVVIGDDYRALKLFD
jgi:hypothetical protein